MAVVVNIPDVDSDAGGPPSPDEGLSSGASVGRVIEDSEDSDVDAHISSSPLS
jgi:hypothetical protein